MALPTTNLTLHVDASDTDNVFTTYNAGGAHSGAPGDGDAVQVWDDEDDGISDVSLQWSTSAGNSAPLYRVNTPLMALPCLDFNGTDQWLDAWDQNGGSQKAASAFLGAGAKTILVAVYPEAITTFGSDIWDNHAIVGDIGDYFGLFLKDDGGTTKAFAYNYDGSVDTVSVNVNAGETLILVLRHDGTTLYLSVNGGSEQSVASGNTADLSNSLRVGKGQSASSFLNGRIGEMALYNAALTGTDLTDAIDYFMAKWLPSGGASVEQGQIAALTLTGNQAGVELLNGIGADVAALVITANTQTVLYLNVRNLILAASEGTELRDHTSALVSSLEGIIYQWYDDPDDTTGNPTDEGTFNTDADGEATIVLSNSALGNGAVGGLLLIHPSDPTIRGYYRVPVTLTAS